MIMKKINLNIKTYPKIFKILSIFKMLFFNKSVKIRRDVIKINGRKSLSKYLSIGILFAAIDDIW